MDKEQGSWTGGEGSRRVLLKNRRAVISKQEKAMAGVEVIKGKKGENLSGGRDRKQEKTKICLLENTWSIASLTGPSLTKRTGVEGKGGFKKGGKQKIPQGKAESLRRREKKLGNPIQKQTNNHVVSL